MGNIISVLLLEGEMRYFLNKIGFGKKIEDEELEEVSLENFISTYYPEIDYELEEFTVQLVKNEVKDFFLKLNMLFNNEIMNNLGGDYNEVRKKLKNLKSPADSEKIMFFVAYNEFKEPLVVEFALNETYAINEVEYLITIYSKEHILNKLKQELI